MTGAVQLAIKDCCRAGPCSGFGSAQTNETVTGALYQLLALAGRSGAPMMVGGVVSMLIPLTVVPAEFPATSLAVPEAIWFVPSPDSVIGDVQLAIPDCCPRGPFAGFGSLQVNVRVTGALYQLLPLAARSGAPVTVGEVLSILKLVEVNCATFNAKSVTVTTPVTSLPSVVRVIEPGREGAPLLLVNEPPAGEVAFAVNT